MSCHKANLFRIRLLSDRGSRSNARYMSIIDPCHGTITLGLEDKIFKHQAIVDSQKLHTVVHV